MYSRILGKKQMTEGLKGHKIKLKLDASGQKEICFLACHQALKLLHFKDEI